MVVRCKAQTTNGTPCSAQPIRDDGYCYWHSPATANERVDARRRGGKAKSNASRAKRQMESAAMTPNEIQGFVAVALRGVMVGSITPGIANAVASLARAAVAVREATELEQRLAELEQRAGVTDTRWRA
jgi:hypothetical protein